MSEQSKPPVIYLTLSVVYQTHTGERWQVTQTLYLPRWMLDYDPDFRSHSMRRFDELFLRELLNRGHLYGSTIGRITSTESSGYDDIMPNQLVFERQDQAASPVID